MQALNTIFSYYDKVVSPLSPVAQTLIALILLVVLIWQIIMIIKSGHWIFFAVLIIMLPGTWPAAKHVLNYLILVFKFLFVRIVA